MDEERDKVNKDNPNKCIEWSCWHYKAKGYIVCTCCMQRRCSTIPEKERM